MFFDLVCLIWLLTLLQIPIFRAVQADPMDCAAERMRAASLASSCCHLTKPGLDPGNKDCALEQKPIWTTRSKKLTMVERIAINICIEECNYIGNGYIDADPPYKLDMNNIEDNIQKFIPKPKNLASKFLLKAYDTCEIFRKTHKSKFDIKFPDVDLIDHTCSPFALQITVCVRMYAMQDCPPEFTHNSTECKRARDFFKECIARVKTE